MRIYRKQIIRIVVFLLVVTIILPFGASALSTQEMTPRASDYLDSYNTYLYNAALGKIRVYFDVTGVKYMDDIGVLTIQVFESTDQETWTWVKTYKHDSYPSMLGHNKIYHSGYVEYSGTIGRYYKAYVTIWSGSGNIGDTRYMWTDIKKATIFAG